MKFRKHLEKKYAPKEKMSDFLKGYEEFKLGVMLKEERKKANKTQKEEVNK